MSLFCLPHRAKLATWTSRSAHFVPSTFLHQCKSTSNLLSLRVVRPRIEGPTSSLSSAIRHYTPMTKQEEESEKQRVAGLSAFAKDQEVRQLNRQIARLEMLRGINTGELYTWRGRYKELSRNYGIPLMLWYGACWTTTAVLVYAAVELFGVDAMSWISAADAYTGFDLASKVDPDFGKAGLVLVVNEMLEPVRLPIVIITCKPVVDRIAPTKY